MNFTPVTTEEEARQLVASRAYWHHKFEIYPGVETPGAYDPSHLYSMLELDESLAGKRVLDVGASNGYFSRELHRRGATVVAFDYRTRFMSGFDRMERCYGHQFDFVHGNLADITTLGLGEFDIILCLGVIYHLPDPIRSLYHLRSMCRETLYVETFVEELGDKPAARYYPADSLAGDATNFWGFNIACVEGILGDIGVEVVKTTAFGDRGLFRGKVQADPGLKMARAYGLLPLKRKVF